MMDRSRFMEKFSSWFQPGVIIALAGEVKWLIRQGKIDAFEFVAGLVIGQMSSLELSLRAQASSYTEPVKREAVHQRDNAQAVDLFSRFFKGVPEPKLEPEFRPMVPSCGGAVCGHSDRG